MVGGYVIFIGDAMAGIEDKHLQIVQDLQHVPVISKRGLCCMLVCAAACAVFWVWLIGVTF